MDAKFEFLNSLNLDSDVKERLSQHLYIETKGKDDVLLSPISRDVSPATLLSELDKVFDSGRDKMNKTLIDLEMDNRAKFGPRSIAIPWKDRLAKFKETFKRLFWRAKL